MSVLNVPILLIVLWVSAYLSSQEIHTEVFRAKKASSLPVTLKWFRKKIYLERKNGETNVTNASNQQIWGKGMREPFVLLL